MCAAVGFTHVAPRARLSVYEQTNEWTNERSASLTGWSRVGTQVRNGKIGINRGITTMYLRNSVGGTHVLHFIVLQYLKHTQISQLLSK